jgi:hypothetical protein
VGLRQGALLTVVAFVGRYRRVSVSRLCPQRHELWYTAYEPFGDGRPTSGCPQDHARGARI